MLHAPQGPCFVGNSTATKLLVELVEILSTVLDNDSNDSGMEKMLKQPPNTFALLSWAATHNLQEIELILAALHVLQIIAADPFVSVAIFAEFGAYRNLQGLLGHGDARVRSGAHACVEWVHKGCYHKDDYPILQESLHSLPNDADRPTSTVGLLGFALHSINFLFEEWNSGTLVREFVEAGIH